MPEFTIGQDRLDFDQIREILQNQLQNYNSWNDILDASTGQMIIDFVAAIGAFNQQGINRALQENFYDTQTTQTAVYRLTRSFGINIVRKIPARVTTRLVNNQNTGFRIEPYSHFIINNIDFFNRHLIDFLEFEELEVELYQGSIRSSQTISTGVDYQRYQIGNPDYSISSFFDETLGTGDIYAVVGGEFSVDSSLGVVGGQRFEKSTIGLWHFGPSDRVFYENTRADGRVEILFGNSLYGVSPPPNSSIVFVWVETLGAEGNQNNVNLDVELINSLIQGTTITSVTNGENEISSDFYKRFGSDIYSTRRRAVTRRDYQALILTYPGIIDVLVEGQQDINIPQTARASGIAFESVISGGEQVIDSFYVSDINPAKVLTYNPQDGTNVAERSYSLYPANSIFRGIEFVNGDLFAIVEESTRSIKFYQEDAPQPDMDFSLVLANSAPRDVTVIGGIIWVVNLGNTVGGLAYNGRVFAYDISNGSRSINHEFDLEIAGIDSLIFNGGAGYPRVPNYQIIDPNPSNSLQNADLSISISNGAVSEIIVTNAGKNYTSPAIIIDSPPENTPTLTAVVNATGQVVSISMSGDDIGYYVSPTITIDLPDSGQRATATAVVANGIITQIDIDNGGSGYDASSPPNVTITPPDGQRIQATVQEITLAPREPNGIAFDTSSFYISYHDGRNVYRVSRADTSIQENYLPLAEINQNPVAMSSDGTTLWVVDDTAENNQVYAYTLATKSLDVTQGIPLTLLGRNSLQWMNVVRLTLLTRNEWTAADWDRFINWLNIRAIATTEYQRNDPTVINLDINVEIFCFERINLAEAENLVRIELTRLFQADSGSLGRSYYLSNLYQFIESIQDQNGRIIDYLILHEPVTDLIIRNQEYINLSNIIITARYSERQRDIR